MNKKTWAIYLFILAAALSVVALSLFFTGSINKTVVIAIYVGGVVQFVISKIMDHIMIRKDKQEKFSKDVGQIVEAQKEASLQRKSTTENTFKSPSIIGELRKTGKNENSVSNLSVDSKYSSPPESPKNTLKRNLVVLPPLNTLVTKNRIKLD